MTTKRIDELTAATSLTAADLIPIMDEATTTKTAPHEAAESGRMPAGED